MFNAPPALPTALRTPREGTARRCVAQASKSCSLQGNDAANHRTGMNLPPKETHTSPANFPHFWEYKVRVFRRSRVRGYHSEYKARARSDTAFSREGLTFLPLRNGKTRSKYLHSKWNRRRLRRWASGLKTRGPNREVDLPQAVPVARRLFAVRFCRRSVRQLDLSRQKPHSEESLCYARPSLASSPAGAEAPTSMSHFVSSKFRKAPTGG